MDPQQNPDHVFKFLFIGNSPSGKSSIITRYANGEFNETHVPTVGLDFKLKTLELNGKCIRLQLWDTAGLERFKSIQSTYYKGVHGVFIVYDSTDRSSFNEVLKWIQEVDQNSNQDSVRMLVGNKSDLINNREVPFEEGKKFADERGMLFLETSAQNGSNIDQAVQSVAQIILSKLEAKQEKPAPQQ